MKTFFCKRKIKKNQDRICLRLQALRKSKKISLLEMAKTTKINKDFLLALEECRFDDLPRETIYKKNILKKYLKALSVDPESFLEQFYKEEVSESKKKNEKIKKKYLHSFPIFLRYGLIFLFLASFLLYLVFQIKEIVEPPKLIIYSPAEGFVTTEKNILLKGETNPEVQVLVNGLLIPVNERGVFDEKIDLKTGINTFVIEANKKHGKKVELNRHVILKEDN